MKRAPRDQAGFIPMLIMLLIILVAIIYFVYTRIMHSRPWVGPQ